MTPARRSTRRRSLSTNESEGTPQAAIKAPAFDTLDEETPANIKQTVVRIKRLQSLSPQQLQTLNTPDKRVVKTNIKSPEEVKLTDKINIKAEAKTPEQVIKKSPHEIKKINDTGKQRVKEQIKSPQQSNISTGENKSAKAKAQQQRKPGPASKTRQLTDEIDDLSDVEVINIEKENVNEKETKANLTTINLIDDDDEDDNDNKMTNKTKLEETSPKHIEDNVTSTQSPESCVNKNKLNYKIDQNATTIDLMDCDDGPLDNTNVMSTQENQQNLTTIDLMETNITTIDLMDCDDTQNGDDIEELSAKETVKLPESSTIEAELSKIDVEPEVAPNTENVNEPPSSTQLESTTVDINEEMSCESKPQETSENESSLNTNVTLLTETKSTEISTKETLESKKTQDTTEIETSVLANETLLNESKSKETPTEGTCEIKKTQKTSVMVNDTLLNKSKSKETPTKWTSENKKIQETSEIATSVVVTETLLNEPESKEIPTKETSEIAKPQETSQIETSAMVTKTLLNESKSKEIPTKESPENKKTQETSEIETSVMVNESKSKQTSEIKNTQETSEIETSEMVNETLLNESKSEEISTKGSLDFQKPEETSDMETSLMVNETLLNESKETPTKGNSEIEKPQENSEIESVGIVNEPKSLEISTIATLENKKTQEIAEIKTAMIINETLNVSKSDNNSTKDIPKDTEPQEVLEVETSMIINESKSNEIPAKEIFKNNKPQEISKVESSVVINETLNETNFHEIPTKEILEKNVQETNKSQPIIEINDKTINSTKTDNSHDQDCTSTQTDEIIPSIMVNSDSQKDSYLKVEENTKICTTPQPPQRKSTATIIEVINITPTQLKSNALGCTSSKNVDFILSPSGDSMIKSVYPKTPAFMKTKSLLEIETQRDMNEETTNTSMSNEKGVTDKKLSEYQSNNEKTTPISEEIHKMEVHQNKIIPQLKQSIVNSGIETPPRTLKNTQDFNRSQNSTPNDAWKIENELQLSNNEVTKSKPSLEKNLEKPESLETKLENNNECTSSDKVETKLKWINACVKGTTTEGGKLDAVVKPKATPKTNTEDNEMDDQHLSQTRRSKAIIFSSDSEGEEDERVQPDDEEEELAPGEKPYKRRHIFHDDEAMEVEDYESGDSMDSEERREMLENEVPVDGESIGSNTTDDEHDDVSEDGEESENDSFIVSDSEEVEPLQLESSEDSDDEDDLVEDEHDRKKKKTYKRIQRSRKLSSPSSSSDEEEQENDTDRKSQSNTVESPNKSMNKSLIKSSDNVLDTSKLSDTALRLQCTADSDSEEQIDELNTNISRKEILRKLNQSDRFNKSVRDLNPEVETSPNEPNIETQYKSNSINIKEHKVDLQKSLTLEKSMPKDENAEQSETENEDDEENQQEEEDEEKSCTEQDSSFGKSSDEHVNVNQKMSKEKQAEFSHLGEVSVTTESDNDKENKKKLSSTLNRSALSVSFGNFPKSKRQSIQRRSFTIGISSKGDEPEIKLIKQVDSPPPSASSSSSSQTSPSTNAKHAEELSSDDARYLENIKHMPLGNPLVRTRRQSLALPTNPDMEICFSSHGGTGISALNKKTKRKSLGLLSGHEFNPSQSFIDSMELRKNEFDRQAAKRKRLSKSFCGTADTMDNSTIDIDVRHLHKRSKLSAENSIIMDNYDSMENINSSKFSTVATTSSTPREKAIKNDSNNNINNAQTKLLDTREKSIKNVSTQRLLSRCHEYLEAANQAKLLDKLKNKKVCNFIGNSC